MSTVKSKNLQVGTDATATNNFTIYQPATPDGTLRIGVGNADSPTEVGQFNANGYVATKSPAFSAYISSTNQSVSPATWTKVTLNAKLFDTTSDYDNSTNYRFTPSVKGYYQVNFALRADATSKTRVHCALHKNGSVWHYGVGSRDSTSSPTYVAGNSLIYLNGSTDYIEMYGYVNGSSTSFAGTDQRFSTFEAFLARAA
jgi:hypothetical protein